MLVAGTANLRHLPVYLEIFSMPYLFDSEEVYKSVNGRFGLHGKGYESTDEAGFRVVTWYNAGNQKLLCKNTDLYT